MSWHGPNCYPIRSFFIHDQRVFLQVFTNSLCKWDPVLGSLNDIPCGMIEGSAVAMNHGISCQWDYNFIDEARCLVWKRKHGYIPLRYNLPFFRPYICNASCEIETLVNSLGGPFRLNYISAYLHLTNVKEPGVEVAAAVDASKIVSYIIFCYLLHIHSGKPGICFHYHCAVFDECK